MVIIIIFSKQTTQKLKNAKQNKRTKYEFKYLKHTQTLKTS